MFFKGTILSYLSCMSRPFLFGWEWHIISCLKSFFFHPSFFGRLYIYIYSNTSNFGREALFFNMLVIFWKAMELHARISCLLQCYRLHCLFLLLYLLMVMLVLAGSLFNVSLNIIEEIVLRLLEVEIAMGSL